MRRLVFGLYVLFLILSLPLVSMTTVTATTTTPIALRPTFPPLPTSTPCPTATPRPTLPPGAYIELHLSPADPSLWTQVEWLDGLGHWHRVDGWQGPIDYAKGAIGIKRWWLATDLFGRGPFRWAILTTPEGEYIATSQPFTLPSGVGITTIVSLSLTESALPR